MLLLIKRVKTESRDQDIDDIVSYALKDKSSDWLQSLLGLKFMYTGARNTEA